MESMESMESCAAAGSARVEGVVSCQAAPRGGTIFGGRIDTPALVLGSTHNSLEFTNTNLAEEIGGYYVSQLEIGDIIKKPFGQLPLKALHTKPSRQLELLSPRPMGSTPLPTSAKSIGVAGCNGRQQVTISEYIARLQLDQPEGAVLMADEVAWHMSSKRLRTAVERTLGWFAEFRALSRKALTDNADDSVPSTTLFGVVVGGHSCGAEHLERQILAYMEGGVTGLVIGGVGQGESLQERGSVLQLVRQLAGPSVPLMVQGVDTLPEILHALSHGVDIISSDYPRVLSSVGLVLHKHFLEGEGQSNSQGSEDSSAPMQKRQKLEVEGLKDVPLLNLWDTKYRKDVKAILPGCTCHCCRLYSRAYLHHLLLSHELLADSMLYLHNRHSLLQLFDAARSHIRTGNFADWAKDFLPAQTDTASAI